MAWPHDLWKTIEQVPRTIELEHFSAQDTPIPTQIYSITSLVCSSSSVAISLSLFENPCKCWIKILEEETLSMAWDESWLSCLTTFYLVCFSYQFRRLYGNFVDFLLFIWSFEKKRSISINKIIIYFYWDHITWIFLILMSRACSNNFWCYAHIWVSFKENRDNFLCFIW